MVNLMMISTRFEEFTIIQTYFFPYFLLDIKWYSGGCLKLGLQTDVKVWFQTAFILSLALCGCLRHIALITGTPPTFCSYLLFVTNVSSSSLVLNYLLQYLSAHCTHLMLLALEVI